MKFKIMSWKTVNVILACVIVVFFIYSYNTPGTQKTPLEVHFDEVHRYNGLECITYRNSDKDFGMTCDWEKHNRQVEQCEAESLKRRTTKDGRVFPAVKGECKNY